jgi:hypothetical protein
MFMVSETMLVQDVATREAVVEASRETTAIAAPVVVVLPGKARLWPFATVALLLVAGALGFGLWESQKREAEMLGRFEREQQSRERESRLLREALEGLTAASAVQSERLAALETQPISITVVPPAVPVPVAPTPAVATPRGGGGRAPVAVEPGAASPVAPLPAARSPRGREEEPPEKKSKLRRALTHPIVIESAVLGTSLLVPQSLPLTLAQSRLGRRLAGRVLKKTDQDKTVAGRAVKSVTDMPLRRRR